MPEPLDLSKSAELRERLRQLESLLRETTPIPENSQAELAELFGELGRDVDPDQLPAAEQAHLAELIDHLEKALTVPPDTGLLATVREFAVRAETRAPVATGIAHRIIEVLANLGI